MMRKLSLVVAAAVLLLACEDAAQREAKDFQRGKTLFENGDLVTAKIAFRNVVQLNPNNIDALYHLGLINERQQNWTAAYFRYSEVALEKPEHLQAQLKLGYLLVWSDQLDLAEEQAETLQELDGENPQVLVFLGALDLRRGQLASAKRYAETALSIEPAHVESSLLLAEVLQKEGATEKALTQLSKSLELNSDNVSILSAKAKLLLQADNFEEAEELFLKIFELEPDSFELRLFVAQQYALQNRITEAEKVLRDAISIGIGRSTETKLMLVKFLEQYKGYEFAEAETIRLVNGSPDDYALRFALAGLYSEKGKLEDAKVVLREIIEGGNIDEVAIAQISLARIYLFEGNLANAKEVIDQALESSPGMGEALLFRAQLNMNDREWESAIGNLRQVLRRTPELTVAWRMLAEAHLLSGNIDLAVDSLRRLINIDPADTTVRQRLAFLLARRGDQEAALRLLDDVLKRDPTAAAALQTAASLLIARQDWRKADKLIQTMLSLPDTQVSGTAMAGILALARGRYDQALDWFQKTRQLDPGYDSATTGVVFVYLSQGKIDEAEETIRRAIEASPQSPTAHDVLGDILVRQGKFNDAEEAFMKVIALSPNWATPYAKLGQLFLGTDRPDRAEEIFERGIEVLPNNLRLLMGSGNAKFVMGDYDGALASYEYALELDSLSQLAANNFGAVIADFFYQDRKALDRALEAVRQFETTQNPLYLDTLAWVQIRLGDLRQSLVHLERASQLAPDNPQIQYHLGSALYKRGDRERALEALEKAVIEDATYTGIDEARGLLAELRRKRIDGSD